MAEITSHLSGRYEVPMYDSERGRSNAVVKRCDICYALVMVDGLRHYLELHATQDEKDAYRHD